MATRHLPHALPRRPTAPTTTPLFSSNLSPSPSHTPLSHTPSRAATLIRRPRRPYAFTQLVQLSDGSTFTMRTASPVGMYKSTKDTRNHALWNPNEKSLQNVEIDEAGKLAAFRERFGRGWDTLSSPTAAEGDGDGSASDPANATKKGGARAKGGKKTADVPAAADSKNAPAPVDTGDVFGDLIAGYAVGMPELPGSGRPPRAPKKK